MITFEKFGNKGRLGNQLFQYASMVGLSNQLNKELILPFWKYHSYFTGKFPHKENNEICIKVNELNFHYDSYNFINDLENIDFEGYFQSEKYWENCKNKVKELLTFTEEFKIQCRKQATIKTNVFNDGKRIIAISIRRGDYIDNPNYELISITHYILTLKKHFPNWRECNIIVFSDDIPYCKVHFGCLENVYFSENNSDIEDICLMSQCDDFIIANSTFSWWGAYIGEKEDTKVIVPNNYFKGDLFKKCNIKDFYPERWIKEDFTNKKIDLKDVTFTIPVCFDHNDRKQNFNLSVCNIQHYFNTNIIVLEKINENEEIGKFEYSKSFCNYSTIKDNLFHRTKMLNIMAKQAITNYIANWDCDIMLPPIQILETINKLRKGSDMVFPYDGRFARMPRLTWFRTLEKYLDIGYIRSTIFHGMNPANDNFNSVGGAVFFNRLSFYKGGMENENFISFGAEDVERFIRFKKLEFKVERIIGVLYHINHYIGVDSSLKNPYFKSNDIEYKKVDKMSKKELINYIKTWNWLKT